MYGLVFFIVPVVFAVRVVTSSCCSWCKWWDSRVWLCICEINILQVVMLVTGPLFSWEVETQYKSTDKGSRLKEREAGMCNQIWRGGRGFRKDWWGCWKSWCQETRWAAAGPPACCRPAGTPWRPMSTCTGRSCTRSWTACFWLPRSGRHS